MKNEKIEGITFQSSLTGPKVYRTIKMVHKTKLFFGFGTFRNY